MFPPVVLYEQLDVRVCGESGTWGRCCGCDIRFAVGIVNEVKESLVSENTHLNSSPCD